MKHSIALLSVGILMSLASVGRGQPNLAVNGDFEKGSERWPFVPSGAVSSGEATKETAHSGSYSYKITNKSAFAPNVYGRIFQLVSGLQPYTTYRISCWVKGGGVGICWIGGGPGWSHRKRFPEGDFDWTYVETEWSTDASAPDYDLMVATESVTKALFVDDIRMEPIRADQAKRDAVLKKFNQGIGKEREHLKRVQEKVQRMPGAQDDPIIRLGLYVAQRFLDRAEGKDAKQSMTWSNFQIEEVATLLDETEKELTSKRSAKAMEWPTGGPVQIRDGVFYTDTTVGRSRPFFFYGMGHFGQIFRDLPNWKKLGVTMLQDGRVGPSGMKEDGTFLENAQTMLADMKRAQDEGIKIDYLLSPHYFPEWAWNKAREELLQGGHGFLNFNIDHPVAKDAVGRWSQRVSEALRDHPALFSICLSNEPVYDDSGRLPQTIGLYREYLKSVHKKIDMLNELYGTSYKSFDEVNPPGFGLEKEVTKNRAFYDWCRFNQKHFADWHAWMRDILKKNLPDVPVHAKIMVFFSFDRDKLGWGVDPEAFCDATDIAGCDAYAFPDGDYKSYQWHGHEFWYDVLNSFRNQSVFNSENHIIPDGTGAAHIPTTMTRAQYWQGALHHQGVTTTWVWEEAHDSALTGSIYFRPANIYGAGRAFIDINRHAQEIEAINLAPARIALLYSQPSIFWEEKYRTTIMNMYTHLNFLGEKVTFVSEKMLRQGRLPKVQWIVLPQATHVEERTVQALVKWVKAGGKVLAVGEGNLAFDEYHRPRNAPAELTNAAKFEFAKEAQESQKVLNGLGLQNLVAVEAGTRKPAWNVEYRLVNALLPIINFEKKKQEVAFPSLSGKKAVDLLSGEAVDLQKLELEPMTPHLLAIESAR